MSTLQYIGAIIFISSYSKVGWDVRTENNPKHAPLVTEVSEIRPKIEEVI